MTGAQYKTGGEEKDTYAHLNHHQQGKEGESKLSGDATFPQCSQPIEETITMINGDRPLRRDRVKLFILLVSLVVNVAAIAIAVTAYVEANSASSSAAAAESAVRSKMGEGKNETSGEFPSASTGRETLLNFEVFTC